MSSAAQPARKTGARKAAARTRPTTASPAHSYTRAQVQSPTQAHARATTRTHLTTAQYQQLAEFRHQLRKFLNFSQDAADQAGVRPQQYQLMLAVQGMPAGVQPTIAAVAARLVLRHNSAVELVDRTAEMGLLSRVHDPVDHRRILLRLTPEGERMLRSLAAHHLNELERAGPELIRALRRVVQGKPAATAAAHQESA